MGNCTSTFDLFQAQGESPQQSSECINFCSFIRKSKHDMICFMKTEFGLLDALASNKVLTARQVLLIREKDTDSGQVRQLLDMITMERISYEKKEAFLNALDQTQQKHVSNWIRGQGKRAAEYGDDWPLLYCAEFSRLSEKTRKVKDLLDSRNGLLDELLAVTCINLRQKHFVEAGVTDEDKNDRLYQIVMWGGLATYKLFLDCLKQTKQHPVVSLLEPSVGEDVLSLSDKQLSRLLNNHSILVRIINLKNGLTAYLVAADCITWRQKEYIEAATTESEGKARLLDIIRRGSQTDFHKFIECLNETRQHHVSRILDKDGAVAVIVATLSPAKNIEQQESRIDERLKASLSNTPDEPFEEVRRRYEQFQDNDVAILTAQKGHSIGLFYFITSLEGLQYLREIYSNEQLKSMMEIIFILLSKTDNAVLVPHIDTLRWDLSNYTNCIQQMYAIANLPILSHVYEMANQNQEPVGTSDDESSIPIDQFPFELLEILLIHTSGHLFVTINRTTPARAVVYTVATLMAVSHLWYEALSFRKYIKRLLKRSFKRVCHPFECSPQLVANLPNDGRENVWGVAVFNDELYVAYQRSNTIHVFDDRPPFSRRRSIKVQGLSSAWGITVCNESSQLYIADQAECAIWRMNVLSSKPADKFITIQWKPWTLSVNSSRLLITPIDGRSMYVYGDDGNELHHIKLPRYMIATHAVETTRNTYVVSHSCTSDTLYPHSVTEFDINGRVIRTLNDVIDSIHVNAPSYLVLDNDHVLVADRFNERIILLKSDLQTKRILINELHGKLPMRMCLTSSRLLVVSYYQSTDIDVFKV